MRLERDVVNKTGFLFLLCAAVSVRSEFDLSANPLVNAPPTPSNISGLLVKTHLWSSVIIECWALSKALASR